MRTHTVATALALIAAAPARALASEDGKAYEAARRGYYVLKASPGKGHGREAWTSAAARFEQVARSFPHSDKAPLALYTAAELRNQVSRISLVAADREAARQDYEQVARRYPDSQLADDALYQIARIALDRENDSRRGRAALTDLLERYPHSDMAGRARKLLASLPAPRTRVRAVSKPAGEQHAASEVASSAPTPAAAAPRSPPAGPPATALPTPQSPQAPPDAADDQDDEDGDDEGPASVDEALREKNASPKENVAPAAEPTEPPARPGPATALRKPAAEWHGLLDALRRAGPSPGGVPLAVQMGLRVRRVMIDAGHGGRDSGAIGPDGTREKDVTLAVAQKLAQDLKAQGLEVLLSRNDDRFVALEDRAAFANREKADLFISIHCNAARDRKLRGTETYFLNVTDDRYALKLAARENQASEKSLSDLQMILADMATKADVEESERLARSVQHTLVDGSHDQGRHDLGVKHALFYVLLGTKMPSVLVETAFLSNPEDARKLRSDRYQAELAHAIAQGVAQFLEQRQGFADAVR